MRAESLHAIILLAVVVGLGLAVFALAESVDPALQGACSVNAFFSCHAVDTSGHTTTLGVQDYDWGIGGFLVLLAIDVPLYRSWRPPFLAALGGVSAIGVGLSAYLAYVELVQIDALCPVCLSCYIANVVVLASALALLVKARSSGADAEEAPAAGRAGESAPGGSSSD